MSVTTIIELAAALLLIGAGIWLYRRPAADGGRADTQSAVLLLAVGAILAIHGLGLLEYRPTGGELAR